jgi:hypothetical protein
MKRIPGSSFTVLPVILTAMAVTAMAAVVTFFPSDNDPGVPAYARIELVDGKTPLVHHDKEWAAIAFYREPACVPAGFNLLEFLDIPKVFECPMTVSGFSIWKNAPAPVDPSPIHTESYGNGAVPVWFVRWEVLRAALGDNSLTMLELNTLNPLKGSASFFKETLNPLPGAKRTMTQIVARGTLEDGRTFDLQSVEKSRSELNDIESNTVTTIRFK